MSKEAIALVDNHQKLIENYYQALNNIRNTYFNMAKLEEMNSLAQNEKIYYVFILDFMIESNKQLLNYLHQIKQHDNPFSTQALKELFETLALKENEDVNQVIQRLKEIMKNDWPTISNKLRDTYSLISIISFLLMATCLPLTVALGVTMGPSLMIAMPIILIGGILVVLTAQTFKHFRQLWVENFPSEPDNTTLFEKSYADDFKLTETREENHSTITTITRLFDHKKESLRGALREKFSNELSNQVTEEYNKISCGNR